MVQFAILIINNQINKMSSARLNNLPESRFEKLFQSLKEWFEYKNKDEWLKDMKTSIILAASIIATMTFSLATNPPGGVLQASFDDVNRGCLTSNVTGFSLCVGEAYFGLFRPRSICKIFGMRYNLFHCSNYCYFFAC
jgi:hypothetical protein